MVMRLHKTSHNGLANLFEFYVGNPVNTLEDRIRQQYRQEDQLSFCGNKSITDEAALSWGSTNKRGAFLGEAACERGHEERFRDYLRTYHLSEK